MNSENTEKIRDICKKYGGQRLPNDVRILMDFTKDIKLFKDLTQKQGENSHYTCCQYLLYEYFNPQTYIFRHGEIGTKFYIILSGLVSIELPQSEGSQMAYTEVMTFTAGSSFGELALENSKPRSASAISKTPCHLLVLLKKDYTRLIQKIVTDKKNEMTFFLQSLPAFEKLNKVALSKLTYNIKEASFTRGQNIFIEGEQAKEIFIVRDGECKLCKSIAKPPLSMNVKKIIRRQLHTAKRLGKGSMIGEDDVFNKTARTYTCICASTTATVYVIPSIDFFNRITAEQPLRYLKRVSKDKKRFLDGWAGFRESLDEIFTIKQAEVAKIKVKHTSLDVNNIDRLNQAVTERKILMSRAGSMDLKSLYPIMSRATSRENMGKSSNAFWIVNSGVSSIKEIKNLSVGNTPLPRTAIPGQKIRHKRTNTFVEVN